MMEYADYIASWIRKIDKRLSGPADHGEDEALVESVVSVFSDIDGIKRGLDTYRGRVYIGGMSSDDYTDYRGDLEKLKGKLEWHMVREGMQRAASSPSEAAPSVKVEVNPTVSASSSSNADAAATSNSVTNVLGSIEADAKLSEDEKKMLGALLAEVEDEAKQGGSGAFARIGARVLKGIENATPGVVAKTIGYLASVAAAHFGLV